MLSRRNLVVVIAFNIFACTLLLTSKSLTDICLGPIPNKLLGVIEQQPVWAKNVPANYGSGNAGNRQADALLSKGTAASEKTGGTTAPMMGDTEKSWMQDAVHRFHRADTACENFPNMSNILVVMKTGASESYRRIPIQLMTNLKCVPNYQIWSDMAQVIAGQNVFDSLANVLDEVKAHNDFELYHRQRKCPIDQESCNKNYDSAGKGWALDKYKNIHIAEKIWAKHDGYDWYFYMDADTYVSWPTLVEWLKNLDPRKPLYLGSVALLAGFPFGHGGSGYVVSNAGMKKMFGGKHNVANKYDKKATETCCGDYLFAHAIKEEAALDVQNMHPTINGDKPNTMPYYEGHWCQPIITMHHVLGEDIDELDRLEESRIFKAPLQIKDIFDKLVKPKLNDTKHDWDNLSDDDYYFDEKSNDIDREKYTLKKGEFNEAEKLAHESFDNCRAACESLGQCLQFRYSPGICSTAKAVRFGAPADSKFKSGWHLPRILRFAEANDECGAVKYPSVV